MGAARNVGKGLIDGNPLNEGRKIINYLDGRIAQPLVVLEMAANKNELRTELARSSAGHTPADPAGPGFVGSGENDSATDGDGAAAQGWIEQLLDRSIERIQVCMKDRGCRFQLFFVHYSGQLTKGQQGAEPGQIASEYSGVSVMNTGNERLLSGALEEAREQFWLALATARRFRVTLYYEAVMLARLAEALRQLGRMEEAGALVEATGARAYEPFRRLERAWLAGDELARERELLDARRLFMAMGATRRAEAVA
jgi:hypothetical protein